MHKAMLVVAAAVAVQFGVGIVGSIRGNSNGKPPGPCGGHKAAVHPLFQSPNGNLVQDGDIESPGDAGQWTPFQASVAGDECFAKFGSTSLEVAAAASGSFLARYDAVAIGGSAKPGTTFSASMWIYVSPGSNLVGKIMALQLGEDDAQFQNAAQIVLHPGWQRLAGTMRIPLKAHLVGLAPYVVADARPGDSFHVDGVDLEELTP